MMKRLALLLLLALAIQVVVSTSTSIGGQLSIPSYSYSLGASLVLSGVSEGKPWWGRRRRRFRWAWYNRELRKVFRGKKMNATL